MRGWSGALGARATSQTAHSGGRCPECGASPSGVSAGETVAVAADAWRPPAGDDSSRPDYQLSVRDPIGDARFAPGHIFAGRYRIVSLLGRGAMGEVYRADDLRIGQPIALKLLAVPTVRERQVQQFVAEVRLARDIGHPNIVRVLRHRPRRGLNFHYLVDGVRRGPDAPGAASTAGRLFARGDALTRGGGGFGAGAAAHGHVPPIVHRDIKPSNIMIEAVTGRFVLMDFGLAVANWRRADRRSGRHSRLHGAGAACRRECN